MCGGALDAQALGNRHDPYQGANDVLHTRTLPPGRARLPPPTDPGRLLRTRATTPYAERPQTRRPHPPGAISGRPTRRDQPLTAVSAAGTQQGQVLKLSEAAGMMVLVPPAEPATRLIGRDKELQLLTGLTGPTPSAGSGAVLVSGDAGVGKTRLL